MELTAAKTALFSDYLGSFSELAGDQRTRALLHETVRGIIGAESLCCAHFSVGLQCGGSGSSA